MSDVWFLVDAGVVGVNSEAESTEVSLHERHIHKGALADKFRCIYSYLWHM